MGLHQSARAIARHRATASRGAFALVENLEKRVLFAGVFQEAGGLVVAEIESEPTTGAWVKQTNMSGYTGSGYYTWNGSNQFNNTGVATLRYEVNINSGGTYNLRIRNRHDQADRTEHNDVWLRVDNGSWVKAYSNTRGAWVYNLTLEPSHGRFVAPRFNLGAGKHTIEISARSGGFSIDRLVLYKDGVDGTNPSLPQSSTGGSSTPPPSTPVVSVVANDASASENGDTGEYTITRTGSTSSALTVNLGVGGTATNNSDYNQIFSTITIPAGSSSAKLKVTPKDDSLVEGSETVVLTVNNGNGYSVDGGKKSATVTIADNDSSPMPTPSLGVSSLTLIDADTNKVIPGYENWNGGTLNLASLPSTRINVLANVQGSVASVRFGLDGNANYRTENEAPYAFAGNSGSDYYAWTPSLGNHTITATPFSGKGATGTKGTAKSISFNVVNQTAPSSGPGVEALRLINAATDQVVNGDYKGGTITQANLRQINFAAVTTGSVGSVQFKLNGKIFKTENVAIFAFNGNNGDDYYAWTPAKGSYTLTATAFSGKNATGAKSADYSISFTIA